MQNYYIIIEDMLSLVSHKLSIIKYVVLKKIIFSFSVLFGLGLDLDSNLFGLGLDSPGLGLVLNSTKVDLTTALSRDAKRGDCGRPRANNWRTSRRKASDSF